MCADRPGTRRPTRPARAGVRPGGPGSAPGAGTPSSGGGNGCAADRALRTPAGWERPTRSDRERPPECGPATPGHLADRQPPKPPRAGRQGADVRRFGRMEQVARREHARTRLAAPDRPAAPGSRIEFAAGHRRKFVVGDPVSAEDHQVAFDVPPGARFELCELHRLPPPSRRRGSRSAGCATRPGNPVPDRGAGAETRREWCFGARVTRPATEAPACASVATAEKLTCSAPTITARRPTLCPPQVNELLQRTRSSSRRSGSDPGDEPRRAGAFAAARRQHHCGRLELPAPLRPGQLQPPFPLPAR